MPHVGVRILTYVLHDKFSISTKQGGQKVQRQDNHKGTYDELTPIINQSKPTIAMHINKQVSIQAFLMYQEPQRQKAAIC